MAATYRLLRLSVGHQFCSRLPAEPFCNGQLALLPKYSTKVALRTPRSDPSDQVKEDIGKFYTMPEEVRKRLFPQYVLPLYFERLADVFRETSIIVRQPALELIDYLKRADYNRPVIRYVLYGKFGCGKTMTLVHAMNYALNNNFLIVYVPSVWRWYHWSKEVVSIERDDCDFDLPLDGANWLKLFEMTNQDLITKLDLRVSQTYEWSQREKTEEGAPLNELVTHGITRVKYSCQVIEALLKEIKIHSCNNRCKTFVAIDGFNGFFQMSSRLKCKDTKARLIPYNVSLTKSFLSFVQNDWKNGAVVLVADDHASVKGEFSSHFPFHLLRKLGVETIDPFVPINVPVYTPLEFQNYLDYLEEMRWLQKPEGRDEIDFVTQRNPRLVNSYCVNR